MVNKPTNSYIPGYHWVEVEEGTHGIVKSVEGNSKPLATINHSEYSFCDLDERKRTMEFHLLERGIVQLPPVTKDEVQMKLILDDLEGGYAGTDHELADKILCDTLRYLGYNDLIDTYEKISKWYE